MKKMQKCKPWQKWGTADDIRQLRGYSADTAKKAEPKEKPKLRLIKGGKKR